MDIILGGIFLWSFVGLSAVLVHLYKVYQFESSEGRKLAFRKHGKAAYYQMMILIFFSMLLAPYALQQACAYKPSSRLL
jgi:hypothetical protein